MKRALRAIISAMALAVATITGFLVVTEVGAFAHSTEDSETCTGVHFKAFANYEGNAANNTVTIVLDGGAPQVFNFDHDGITKDLSWPALKAAHSWSWSVNANINSGNPTAYDTSGGGSVDGCPEPAHIPVTLCHKDGQSGNYSKITTDDDGVLNHGNAGHSQHDGDIIPPFTGYAGKNWDADGQAIYNNNCVVPPPPTTQPPPTTAPPTTPPPTTAPPTTQPPVTTAPPTTAAPTTVPAVTDPPTTAAPTTAAPTTAAPTTLPAVTTAAPTTIAALIPPETARPTTTYSLPTPPTVPAQGLPRTGSKSDMTILIGGLLLIAGAGATALARRRKPSGS